MPSLFGQVQLRVHQRVEVGRSVAQVDRDHAVLRLADHAAVLALYTGRLVALLDEAGLIQYADAVSMPVPCRDRLLTAIPHGRLVPAVETQQLLQVPRRNPRGIGHGLDALAGQRPQLPLHVRGQVLAGRAPPKTIVKLMQVFRQSRSDPQNRVGVHAMSPSRNRFPVRIHRPVA